MASTTIDTTTRIIALADAAYQAFCNGVSTMLGVAMQCNREQAGVDAVAALERRFPKLAVAHMVAADGVLKGVFHLLFDQAGLFILPGTVIMLPKGRILEQVELGSLDHTESQQDAAKEIGGLLVGSWDRVFRDECPGHKHFIKKASLIGKLSEKFGQMGLSVGDQALLVFYKMTIEAYPSFTCAAVLPASLLAGIDRAGG